VTNPGLDGVHPKLARATGRGTGGRGGSVSSVTQDGRTVLGGELYCLRGDLLLERDAQASDSKADGEAEACFRLAIGTRSATRGQMVVTARNDESSLAPRAAKPLQASSEYAG
jgi:hypothetical protein